MLLSVSMLCVLVETVLPWFTHFCAVVGALVAYNPFYGTSTVQQDGPVFFVRITSGSCRELVAFRTAQLRGTRSTAQLEHLWWTNSTRRRYNGVHGVCRGILVFRVVPLLRGSA